MGAFFNKEVQIYPGDTYSKFGVVQEITEAGVVFKITQTSDARYSTDELVFIAFSAKLIFKLAAK